MRAPVAVTLAADTSITFEPGTVELAVTVTIGGTVKRPAGNVIAAEVGVLATGVIDTEPAAIAYGKPVLSLNAEREVVPVPPLATLTGRAKARDSLSSKAFTRVAV
jgi:hypothetical protein